MKLKKGLCRVLAVLCFAAVILGLPEAQIVSASEISYDFPEKEQTYLSKDGMIYEDTSGNFGKTGRWFKKKIAGGKYYFTNAGGSTIYFKVSGSKYVNVNFVTNISGQDTYFSYSVDGASMKRQLYKKNKISVGNTKTHYVRLVLDAIPGEKNRWEELGVGIKSVKPVTKKGSVTAVVPQNEVIAFYGNSITEGLLALGGSYDTKGTSATHSFAWYCAKKLNMVPYFAGYGGTGIAEKGSFNTFYKTITSFSSSRKADKFDAKVIVLEYGTNDVHITDSAFTQEYRKAVKKLHKKHPDACIIAMTPRNGRHYEDIKKAISGLKYCTLVKTSDWDISCDDGLHPNDKGAKAMGKKLAKIIENKLN